MSMKKKLITLSITAAFLMLAACNVTSDGDAVAGDDGTQGSVTDTLGNPAGSDDSLSATQEGTAASSSSVGEEGSVVAPRDTTGGVVDPGTCSALSVECAAGTQMVTVYDKNQCPVTECREINPGSSSSQDTTEGSVDPSLCPVFTLVECPQGQVRKWIREAQCDIPTCVDISNSSSSVTDTSIIVDPPQCPLYSVVECPIGQVLTWEIDAAGCDIPVCAVANTSSSSGTSNDSTGGILFR